MRMGWEWVTPHRMAESMTAPLPAGAGLRAGLGQAALLATDQVEVAQVHEQAGPLAEDEDGVQAVDGVDQQGEAAAAGEEPERDGYRAPLLALGGDPLNEEAPREERLSEEAHRQPEVLCRHHRCSTLHARIQQFTLPDTPRGPQGVSSTVRSIDQTLVDEVWRETASYPPGRVAEEASDFLARQPHVTAFAQSITHEQDPSVQRAALGLCFLLFKVLERSLGHPFPLLSEARIQDAHHAVTEGLGKLEPPRGGAG